jgi:hypothetical protein
VFDGDLFAGFDDDGVVRGLALQLNPTFGPYAGTIVYEMQIGSNSEGDNITFKYYDASEDAVLDLPETYAFVINDQIGDVVDPWIMGTVDLSCPECVDNDAGVAPFNCATAISMFGCDFVFGGVPIGESCPVSCNTCPDDDDNGDDGNDDDDDNAGQTYLILGKSSGWSMDTDLSDADASFTGTRN